LACATWWDPIGGISVSALTGGVSVLDDGLGTLAEIRRADAKMSWELTPVQAANDSRYNPPSSPFATFSYQRPTKSRHPQCGTRASSGDQASNFNLPGLLGENAQSWDINPRRRHPSISNLWKLKWSSFLVFESSSGLGRVNQLGAPRR
jgi:hypothetical protein